MSTLDLTIFEWRILSCYSVIEINRRFGEICCLYIMGILHDHRLWTVRYQAVLSFYHRKREEYGIGVRDVQSVQPT